MPISQPTVSRPLGKLIRYAQELSFAQLQQLANHMVEVVDPVAADRILEEQLRRQERQALAGCELVMSIGPDGTSNGRFSRLFPPYPRRC